MQPAPSWTAHLREARLSGSTPGLHRTPSAPAEVQDEYDPELPDLGPEEYDPEEPALALAGAHNEEYDPEEPALERMGSSGGGDEEYDPTKPPTAAQEEYDPEKNVGAAAMMSDPALGSPRYSYDAPPAELPLTGTPPGIISRRSPRSPEESDDADSDGEHERGRGRESERDRRHAAAPLPTAAHGNKGLLGRHPATGASAFNGAVHGPNGAASSAGTSNAGGNFGVDAVVRSTAAALNALISTARLSEESWYLWGEAGEARLSMAKQFAHGLLANDLLALLRDTNVATEMRWRLTMEHGVGDRAASQQQAETPRVPPSKQQARPPGVVGGSAFAVGMRPHGATRQAPGPGYVCNICGVPGHWIADCPRKAAGSTGSPDSRGAGGAGVGSQVGAAVSRRQLRPPPDGYVCNACKVPGHWIQQCPKRLARSKEQSEQKGAAIEAAPYEDWMSPALSVLQEDSESVSSGAEGDLMGGKRKRASGGPKVVYTQKRAAVMAPPPARVAGRGKELLLAKMKSLVQQAEAAESPAEKRRLLAEIKALQKGAKKKTARQEEAKTGQKTDTPGETDTHPEKAGVEDETEADV